MDLDRRRIGFDPELLFQQCRARLIDPQSADPILVERMQPHRPADYPLVERIEPKTLVAPLDRGSIRALLLEQPDEAIESSSVDGGESMTLGFDPVLVDPREELPTIEVDRTFEGVSRRARVGFGVGSQRGPDGALELIDVDIDCEVGTGLEGQAHTPDRHASIDLGPGAPELMEDLPEVVVGLSFAGIWPQQERQPPARLRHTPMEDQVSKQRLRSNRAERDARAVASDQSEAPEKAEVDGSGVGNRLPFNDSGRESSSGTAPASGIRLAMGPSVASVADGCRRSTSTVGMACGATDMGKARRAAGPPRWGRLNSRYTRGWRRRSGDPCSRSRSGR